MPELPEVEVVKRSLINKIQNSVIKAVKINDSRLRYKINRNELKKIIGLRLKKIKRRSKYLLFFFNKDIVMLVHLGMTGKFFFINQKNSKFKTSFYYNIQEEKDKKHDRVIFYLSKKQKLIYNDVRKFGFIKFLNKANVDQNFHLKNLGPEPLNNKFDFIYFRNYTARRKRTAKDLLMDQKFVSGLGNIYVNEILFFSGVNPKKEIQYLSDLEIKNENQEKQVAIKILRPDIEKLFNEELDALMLFAYIVENTITKAKRLKLIEVVHLLREITNIEMDLRFEAAAANELYENTKLDKGFNVPKIYWNYTTKKY
jgi:formamidopyrimidine-DNA glycosylase